MTGRIARTGAPTARRWTRAILLSVVGAAAGISAEAAAGQAVAPEVRSVRFEGNEAFDDAELQLRIRTRATRCKSVALQILMLCPLGFDFAHDERFLNRRRGLGDDIARLRVFYYLRGYRAAEVDTLVVDREVEGGPEVDVTFSIRENAPIIVDSLEILWPDGSPVPEAVGTLLTRPDFPLDGEALSLDRDSIRARLQGCGVRPRRRIPQLLHPQGSAHGRGTVRDLPRNAYSGGRGYGRGEPRGCGRCRAAAASVRRGKYVPEAPHERGPP